MGQITQSAARSYSTVRYDALRGVDFTNDPTQVSKRRSPDGLNMISDEGGNPVKRRGWKTWSTAGTGRVNDLWTYQASSGNTIVANVGTTIRVYDADAVSGPSTAATVTNLTSGKKCATITKDGLLVFAGNNLVMCDSSKRGNALGKGVTLSDGTPFEPYVPTIIVGSSSTGGGTAYEGINLMTREVKETFFTDGTATVFTVSAIIDTSKAYSAKIDGSAVSIASVYGKNVTLASTPAAVSDRATLEIQYFRAGTGTPEKIYTAKAVHSFSEGTGRRWFTADKDSNVIHYSELDDYTYWPDNNYMVAGTNKTIIQGFMPVGEYLGVIKESSDKESTLYFITATTLIDTISTTDSEGKVTNTGRERYTFKIISAAAGVGAVNDATLCVLSDEPLFLSERGIFGIASVTTTSEKALQRRSRFADGKLLKEGNLENAVACIYKGYYFLVVNSHAYLLDSRRSDTSRYGRETNYEAYYLENIPATAIISTNNDKLFFGTSNGNICTFKNTGDDRNDYSDDGSAITARWSTCDDNDGYPSMLKTMQKKGSSITLKPYQFSSVDVYAEIDGSYKKYFGSGQVNIWTSGFNNTNYDAGTSTYYSIDFNKFTFDTRTGPREKFIGKKIKKYKRLKLILENGAIEPFGIYAITKTIEVSKYAKK